MQIPGEVVYLHPEHNLAVIRYDPAAIGDTPAESATLKDARLEIGDEVWLVGMTASERLVTRKTRIARKEPLQLPVTYPPRFRESNVEVVTLEDSAATVGGVASTTASDASIVTASPPASRPLTRSPARVMARTRLLNRTGQPSTPSRDNAGSTKLRERPAAAMRGRQAASPRPKVSRSTGHNRAAAPSSAGALRTATASGSQKRR